MGDTKHLTVIEAARRLNITPDSVRARLRRKTLDGYRDNLGRWLVVLGDTMSRANQHDDRHDADTMSEKPAGAPETIQTNAVADILKAHQAAMEAAEERRLSDLADRDRQHRETMAMMLERVDAAEVRAERCEAKLNQVLDQFLADRRLAQGPRPWWCFW